MNETNCKHSCLDRRGRLRCRVDTSAINCHKIRFCILVLMEEIMAGELSSIEIIFEGGTHFKFSVNKKDALAVIIAYSAYQ